MSTRYEKPNPAPSKRIIPASPATAKKGDTTGINKPVGHNHGANLGKFLHKNKKK
jgi:hypothetical protein